MPLEGSDYESMKPSPVARMALMISARRDSRALRRAVQEMRVVVAVLDIELDRHDAMLAEPVPRMELSSGQRESAEAARREVDDSLRMLEAFATERLAMARDWQAKAILADQAGRAALAEQARRRAAMIEREYLEYAREIDATRAFLQRVS
jgi:hypothetical protein